MSLDTGDQNPLPVTVIVSPVVASLPVTVNPVIVGAMVVLELSDVTLGVADRVTGSPHLLRKVPCRKEFPLPPAPYWCRKPQNWL